MLFLTRHKVTKG